MIEQICFRGRKIWLMRDDLLGVFNGNKARKLEYFLNADLGGLKRIVSHGSSQSNAMYSLSVFAKMKELEFCYVVSHISSNLQKEPIGNFKFALLNGMKLFVSEDRKALAKELSSGDDALFIEEGVAMSEAETGFKTQAREIEIWADKMGLASQNEILKQGALQDKEAKILDIFLPSGTGTSAAYLAKNSKFSVYTCPCVGDARYLKEQIALLDPNSKAQILNPPKKYHFGDLKTELYEIWLEILNECGVEFDLIYDPVGLMTLWENISKFRGEIFYIHQGGLIGNISQKLRYERKMKGIK